LCGASLHKPSKQRREGREGVNRDAAQKLSRPVY
jgi:hypothetical protein